LPEAIEDSVDERRRVGRAVAAGELNRLVEYHCGRCLRCVQELVSAQAQDVAIYPRHPRESPVFCRQGQTLVDVRAARQKSVVQPDAKLSQSCLMKAVRDKLLDLLTVDVLVVVVLKQELKRDFAGAGTLRHYSTQDAVYSSDHRTHRMGNAHPGALVRHSGVSRAKSAGSIPTQSQVARRCALAWIGCGSDREQGYGTRECAYYVGDGGELFSLMRLGRSEMFC
jgi:hypothetical protein